METHLRRTKQIETGLWTGLFCCLIVLILKCEAYAKSYRKCLTFEQIKRGAIPCSEYNLTFTIAALCFFCCQFTFTHHGIFKKQEPFHLFHILGELFLHAFCVFFKCVFKISDVFQQGIVPQTNSQIFHLQLSIFLGSFYIDTNYILQDLFENQTCTVHVPESNKEA